MEVWKWPNADVQNVNIISNAKAIRRTVNWTKSQPWCERERQMRGECGLNIEEKWAAKYFCYSLNARHNGPATLSCCLESKAIFFFVRFFVCCCGVFGARCHRMEIVFRVCSQHTHTQRRISFDRQNAKLYAMRPIWHHHFVCVLHLLLCSLRQQTKHRSRTQYMHMWASPSNHRRIRCIFFFTFIFLVQRLLSAQTIFADDSCRIFTIFTKIAGDGYAACVRCGAHEEERRTPNIMYISLGGIAVRPQNIWSANLARNQWS